MVDWGLTGSGRDSDGDISIDQSLPTGWDNGSVGAICYQYYYTLAQYVQANQGNLLPVNVVPSCKRRAAGWELCLRGEFLDQELHGRLDRWGGKD
jgi:hypothetical protein